MPAKIFSVTAKAKKFTMPGGWTYVPVASTFAAHAKRKTSWGYIPIQATVGKTSWPSFLLPMGKGKGYFIALKANVRKKERLEVGDTVTVRFTFTP